LSVGGEGGTERPGPEGGDLAGTEAIACADEKIAFSREAGCVNDGYVEFCAPSRDAELSTALFAIEPSLEVLAGSGGRAGCDPATHDLVPFPTPRHDPKVCAKRGAMAPEAWKRLCAIAALPQIESIVASWFP
jgi:hypothetical protein